MTDKIPFSAVFIELDALLDTRLSVLHKMGPQVIDSVLAGNYYERIIDKFNNIDNKMFKELYSKRDKSILKEAVVTEMGSMLQQFCAATLNNVINSPFHYKPKIVVNTYPYVLLEEEINFIIEGVVNLTKGAADVEAVYLSYEQITPTYIKSKYTLVVMYEYPKWLETHSANENLKKTTCPTVGMMGPAIYFNDLPTDVEAGNPFKAMEDLAAPFIALKLLPVRTFSFSAKAIKSE